MNSPFVMVETTETGMYITTAMAMPMAGVSDTDGQFTGICARLLFPSFATHVACFDRRDFEEIVLSDLWTSGKRDYYKSESEIGVFV